MFKKIDENYGKIKVLHIFKLVAILPSPRKQKNLLTTDNKYEY